ncbi:MAG: hypothetical protein EBR55_10270, partial [Chitinophagia bacterium]|nr:hypothetical protein [Chitinophagia bacterium]
MERILVIHKALSDIWKTKYAKGRIRQLQKKNNVSYETLFYDDLIASYSKKLSEDVSFDGMLGANASATTS